MRKTLCKNNLKLCWLPIGVFTLLLITQNVQAQVGPKGNINPPLTKNLPLPDSNFSKKKDSVIPVVDSFPIKNYSKDSLDAPVSYSATDSGVLDIPGKKFYLYGKANAKYQTMDLTAAIIEIDNKKQLAKAYGVKDSTGETIDKPEMKDGEMTSLSDSLFYNMKTQRGLTKKTYTTQGEMYIFGDRVKLQSKNIFFVYGGRFTTCNLDTPHFAFYSKKMKVINNKWAYSGFTYPAFEGVPIPIGLPFGIFPLSRGRHSGLLAPSFTSVQNKGLGLENLGYYKVLNEYFDVTLRGSLYSYGGYQATLTPTYRKRYHFNGSMALTFIHSKNNFKGDPDFNVTNAFGIIWNHSVDSKAHPGQSFSANVNASSTKLNSLIPNNYLANITTALTSSIQYSKNWGDGKYAFQASGTSNQNNMRHTISLNLPNLNFSVATFYPFAKKENIGAQKWYEKLGIGYNGQFANSLSWVDTTHYGQNGTKTFKQQILDTLQWSANHSIPISLSLPQLGPFQVSPGISYSEKWVGQKNLRAWNNNTQKLDSNVTRGIYIVRQISTSLSFQTALYGMYHFKNKNLVAIRHTIRPLISANYSPDLEKQYFYRQRINLKGDTATFYAIDGSSNASGILRDRRTGGLSFSIGQQLEAKVKDKSDTSGKTTKIIKLIDNFSINTSYNFLNDSFKLAPISIQLSTTLFDNVSISANTSLIPYEVNKFGNATKNYAWQTGKGFSLGSINSGSLSLSTSFRSKNKDEKKKDSLNREQSDYYNPDEDRSQMEYVRSHPAEFTDFNSPWDLSVSFSLSYYKQPKPDFTGFNNVITSNLNLSGSYAITPKWKMGANAYYDLNASKIGNLTMWLSREMHCWQLSINVSPVGLYQSFNFSISPKSGILRDLKINRTRSFSTNP